MVPAPNWSLSRGKKIDQGIAGECYPFLFTPALGRIWLVLAFSIGVDHRL